jgi:hypothetical protein
MKTYILPITKNYVSNWTILEAVRELIQNGLDGQGQFSITYTAEEEKLSLCSTNTKLEPKKLLLGCSEKQGKAIGKFGEGLKLAIVVLLREKKDLFIFNAEDQWKPEFRWAEAYDEEILHIDELADMSEGQDFAVHVYGIRFETYLKIKELTLILQNEGEIGHQIPCKIGSILTERKGKLYVGGLFVCDTEMEYSYNILPEFLPLERDRQTVGSWQLKSLTKQMWLDAAKWDIVAEGLEMSYQDFDYFEYGQVKDLQEACKRRFYSNRGYSSSSSWAGSSVSPKPFPVESSEELAKAQKVKGLLPVVVKSKVFLAILKSMEDFKLDLKAATRPASFPVKRLQAFLRNHRDKMPKETVESFRHLIKVCKEESWRPEKTLEEKKDKLPF